ncbi:metallopeptidase family protein [candidate division WOR-3 bacterium]|nr:metallopeptidase family protein [candidate division WOR-3 bacterium]
MARLSTEEFEAIVQETIEDLPPKFRKELDERNIVIAVKDEPDWEDIQRFEGKPVLGFYRGVPLLKRGARGYSVWPDRIVIFKSLIERYASTADQTRELLRRVVLHEIGHFFGLSDAELRKLGY